MTKLAQLHIKNFRGIRNLEIKGLNKDLVCFVGRGDCGKTTILEAISYVLSPRWNLNFDDTDFFNCDHSNPITITAYLIDLPPELNNDNNYSSHIQKFDPSTGDITSKIEDDGVEDPKAALAVQLTVDQTLEPKWNVISGRDNQEPKPIGTSTRASMNCFYVSDYVDRHFSWNKGNPLYALFRKGKEDKEKFSNEIVASALRKAKQHIDGDDFENLKEIQDWIKDQASALGLNISNTQTTMDMKDLTVKDGRVSLHDGVVPFRLKGKGSKRLSSYAIQLSLLEEGGIMLADEIEQGLEPDRIRNLVSTLKEGNNGQIFLTTHSRDALVELESNDVCYLKRTSDEEINYRYISDFQKTVRACPEAFFARKVIVCEGKTEVGLCRAFDKWRQGLNKSSLSCLDCAYVDGRGSELVKYTKEIKVAGIDTLLFCDSDESGTNTKKQEMRDIGITIVDCTNGFKIEQQVFHDLPWVTVKAIFEYIVTSGIVKSEESLKASIKSKYVGTFPEAQWKDADTDEMRKAIALASCKDKEKDGKKIEISWFKRIDHGEALGKIIFEHWAQIEDDKHIKKLFNDISNWVEN